MGSLVEQALSMRKRSHAPYSNFRVGAALIDENNAMHSGCNVESASYGLSVCAERNAIAAMVAAGGKRVVEIAVATETGQPPCGACLQVLSEFADASCVVTLVDASGATNTETLGELLPHVFKM